MLLDDLASVIATLQQRISKHGASLRENETRTRVALIDPLLRALGWDVSDPAAVTPEYNVGGRRADYALLSPDGRPAAAVEAKKLGESLLSHRMQMLNYSNASGVEYAGLTDGDHWELYEVFQRGQLEDRKILDVSIADTPAHQCALQLLLLWRPNLASGQPVPANEPILAAQPQPQPDPTPAPAPAEPEPPLPMSPGPPPDGWVALSSFTTERGGKPPQAIRFPGGQESGVRLWRHLVERTARWLWSTQRLTQSNLPVSSSHRRYIVNITAVHPTGKDFTIASGAAGTPLFYEGNISGISSVISAKKLLEHCGINPADVHVRVAPGPE